MESNFYVVLTLEVEVKKPDMTLGSIDENYAIRKYVLKQLRSRFPARLYDMTELHGSYVFSIKKDLKAKPFLDLREKVLSLLDVKYDYYEKDDEENLKEELSNGTIADVIKASQPRIYFFNLINSWFKWREYEIKISARSGPGWYDHGLWITGKGIQIYKSSDTFTGEYYGEYSLLTDPLRALLKKMKYSNLVSVMIEDEKQ